MTEITRLFDLIRDVGPCLVRTEKEKRGSKWFWGGEVYVPGQTFGTRQLTPEADRG